jgi:membrane-associated phospholipid phosphatase
MALSRFLVAALVITLTTPALAEDVIAGHAIDRQANGAVIAGVLGVGLGLSLIPVHTPSALWDHEIFGELDDAVHASFSPRAAQISDGLLAASIAAPIAYLTGDTIEDADGDRLLLYGEALAVNVAVFEGAKHLVQRPRPYLYSKSPEVARYAAEQGDDAYQSFYSGHAATAFCAATAGAYLAGVSTTSSGARALAWGGGFAVAAAAANLRVRAGKHFYSDVVIGAIIGTAIGYVVPALHADKAPYVPRIEDVGAAVAGVLGGSLVSELLPLERHPGDGLASSRFRRLHHAHLHLGPVPITHGAGLGIGGTL